MSLFPSLEATAQALLASGKGLLAADESFPTIEKRFKGVNLASSEETRRAYREMLFTTPDLGKFISGVILFDETIRQKIAGAPAPGFLESQGILAGIKVDKGAIPLPCFPEERITQGLDGLRERLAEYRQLGARFTKWRAVISMGDRIPTRACIAANARALAIFAALSQEAGLVPLVEPETLMDGSHTLARCEEATSAVLEGVFLALREHRVVLEQMVLKTNMAVSGSECAEQADPGAVAAATLRCFRRAVPAAVPGIVFLSGGQSAEMATRRLKAICSIPNPAWKLSFSFGRALQEPALNVWKGLSVNVVAAQKALTEVAQSNGAAIRGVSPA